MGTIIQYIMHTKTVHGHYPGQNTVIYVKLKTREILNIQICDKSTQGESREFMHTKFRVVVNSGAQKQGWTGEVQM